MQQTLKNRNDQKWSELKSEYRLGVHLNPTVKDLEATQSYNSAARKPNRRSYVKHEIWSAALLFGSLVASSAIAETTKIENPSGDQCNSISGISKGYRMLIADTLHISMASINFVESLVRDNGQCYIVIDTSTGPRYCTSFSTLTDGKDYWAHGDTNFAVCFERGSPLLGY